jgi:S1-C subfamily serine protease
VVGIIKMPRKSSESLEERLARICAKVMVVMLKYDVMQPEVTETTTFRTSGSGYVVQRHGRYYIVTNAHVIEFAKSIYVNFPITGHHKFYMTDIGHSERVDTAILQFQDEALFIRMVQPERYLLDFYPSMLLPVSTDVIVCGYGEGDMMAITHGKLMGYNILDDMFTYSAFVSAANRRTVDILILSGNSGSPVLFNHGKALYIVGTINSGVNGKSKSILMASEQVVPLLDFVASREPSDELQWITPTLGIEALPMGEWAAEKLYAKPIGTEVSYVYPGSHFRPRDFIYGVRVETIGGGKGPHRRLLSGPGTYFDIDSYGMAHVPWAIESIPVDWIMSVYPYGTVMTFYVIRDSQETKIPVTAEPFRWRPPYYRTRPLPWRDIGGFVASYACQNHVDPRKGTWANLLDPHLLSGNTVIITGTMPHSSTILPLTSPCIVKSCIRKPGHEVQVQKLSDLEGASAIITDNGILFLENVSPKGGKSGSHSHKKDRSQSLLPTPERPRNSRRNAHRHPRMQTNR